jgi:hypothetical protein
LPSLTVKIYVRAKEYLKGTIKTTADKILRVNIDIDGLDSRFSFVGSNSFASISLPKVDFTLGTCAEEQITVVVEFDHVDGSFVTFENKWLHEDSVYC